MGRPGRVLAFATIEGELFYFNLNSNTYLSLRFWTLVNIVATTIGSFSVKTPLLAAGRHSCLLRSEGELYYLNLFLTKCSPFS
jgi:hypothetical protein